MKPETIRVVLDALNSTINLTKNLTITATIFRQIYITFRFYELDLVILCKNVVETLETFFHELRLIATDRIYLELAKRMKGQDKDKVSTRPFPIYNIDNLYAQYYINDEQMYEADDITELINQLKDLQNKNKVKYINMFVQAGALNMVIKTYNIHEIKPTELEISKLILEIMDKMYQKIPLIAITYIPQTNVLEVTTMTHDNILETYQTINDLKNKYKIIKNVHLNMNKISPTIHVEITNQTSRTMT